MLRHHIIFVAFLHSFLFATYLWALVQRIKISGIFFVLPFLFLYCFFSYGFLFWFRQDIPYLFEKSVDCLVVALQLSKNLKTF